MRKLISIFSLLFSACMCFAQCSQMSWPLTKTYTIFDYPTNWPFSIVGNTAGCTDLPGDVDMNPEPETHLVPPYDFPTPLFAFHTTNINNFTCTQTSGTNGGVQYYKHDSKITANGTCFAHPLLTYSVYKWDIVNGWQFDYSYAGHSLQCNPVFSQRTTAAQNDADFNRFYNEKHDGVPLCDNAQPDSPVRNAIGQGCRWWTPDPTDHYYGCQQPGITYGVDFQQCNGVFGSDCETGTPGGCAKKTLPIPALAVSLTPTLPGVPAPKVHDDPLCGTDPCSCGGGDPGSPILIDVEGEGFHLTSPDNGVMFDIRANGTPVRMGWTDPHYHNAFLVLDRNENGKVDDGKELFGNYTTQPNSDHPNGYIALGLYDQAANGGNEDGIIDARDAIWPKLKLWIDANHDGISQPGELYTLEHFGVKSLSFAYKESRRVDRFGNQFRYKALVNPLQEHHDARDDRKHDGEAGRWTFDVFFMVK